MDWEVFEPTPEDVEEFGDLAYDFAWANACSWYRQEEDQKKMKLLEYLLGFVSVIVTACSILCILIILS